VGDKGDDEKQQHQTEPAFDPRRLSALVSGLAFRAAHGRAAYHSAGEAPQPHPASADLAIARAPVTPGPIAA